MKKLKNLKGIKRFLFPLIVFTTQMLHAQIGIGVNNPSASAQLDISSTTKGLLPPRMTEEQRNIIQNPVAGLIIWCNNCGTAGELQVFNGTAWTNIIGGTASVAPITGVTIGTQVWMQRNLDVSVYRNGDTIPQVTDPSQWAGLTTGAWCYNSNDPANGPVYGKLYNWYAVNDARGLAPTGWHIPSNTEMVTLQSFLGGHDVAGGKMKEAGTTHWASPNTEATNESGFTALPGGFRLTGGGFQLVGLGANWWASNLDFTLDTGHAYSCGLSFGNGTLGIGSNILQGGFSVRCIKE